MAKPMVVTPPCAACGTPAAHIELLAPGQLPAGWDQRPSTARGSFLRPPRPGQWYLLRQDIAIGNSYGGPIDASLAGRIAWALRPPCASPGSAPLGSTTTQDSAPTAKSPTATSTGTHPTPDTATAPTDTAKTWTRTGRR